MRSMVKPENPKWRILTNKSVNGFQSEKTALSILTANHIAINCQSGKYEWREDKIAPKMYSAVSADSIYLRT